MIRLSRLSTLGLAVVFPLVGAQYTYVKLAEVQGTTKSAVVAVALASNGVALLDSLDGTTETLNTITSGVPKKIYDVSLSKITINAGSVNAAGDATVEADTYPVKQDYAVYALSNGILTKIIDSARYTQPYINDRGDISVINYAGLSASGVKLSIRSGQDLRTVAATYSGLFANLSSFAGGAINASGQVVFAAYNDICDGGIYTAGDKPPALAVPFSITGLCLYVGSAISPSPWINDVGSIAFSALDFQRKVYGIYLQDKSKVRTIVESGTFNQFGPVNVNNAGTVVFYGRGPSPLQPGLYVGPDPARDKVIAEGDSLFGSTVSVLLTPAGGSGEPGAWRAVRYLDEQGRILFTYVLKDGRIGAALAIPAENTAPTVPAGGVVPIFGSASSVQPGSWVSIYGTNLATGTSVWNGDFPTALGGVTVTINGKACYLWLVSPTQINLQAPDDSTTGLVDVAITTPTGSVKTTVTLAPRSPSFSLFDGRYPAVVIPTPDGKGAYGGGTYDLGGPQGRFAFSSRPVKSGEIITLYGVGFGPTSPVVPSGKPFVGAAPTIIPALVSIGGLDAKVLFSGITGAGLYQLNVVVPSGIHGDQEIRASISGAFTQPSLFLAIQ